MGRSLGRGCEECCAEPEEDTAPISDLTPSVPRNATEAGLKSRLLSFLLTVSVSLSSDEQR